MIKKFIFSLAIILSLTTHYAVGMDNEDDKLDVSKISVQPGKLDEQHKEGMQIINGLHAAPSSGKGKLRMAVHKKLTYDGGITYLGTNYIAQFNALEALKKQLTDFLFIDSLD